jgi:hypothetical protein
VSDLSQRLEALAAEAEKWAALLGGIDWAHARYKGSELLAPIAAALREAVAALEAAEKEKPKPFYCYREGCDYHPSTPTR